MFSLISCCITFCLLLHTFCDSIQLRNFIRFQIVIVICDLLLLLQRPLPPSSSSSSSSSLSLLFSRLINIFIAFSRPLSRSAPISLLGFFYFLLQRLRFSFPSPLPFFALWIISLRKGKEKRWEALWVGAKRKAKSLIRNRSFYLNINCIKCFLVVKKLIQK